MWRESSIYGKYVEPSNGKQISEVEEKVFYPALKMLPRLAKNNLFIIDSGCECRRVFHNQQTMLAGCKL